jgi:hypothetical protein
MVHPVKYAGLMFMVAVLFLAVVAISGCAGNNTPSSTFNASASSVSPTVTPSPSPTMMVFIVTPDPDMVYPKANVSNVEYTVTPDTSFISNYSIDEYPRIIDNGNGTIDVTIYVKSAAGQIIPIAYENVPLYYNVVPTEDSTGSLGPPVIRGIEAKGFLSVQIWPLPDNTGNVIITATTPLGIYGLNGTIVNPLEIQPVLYAIDEAKIVINGQMQIAPGYYWDIAPVHARNQTLYVITKIVEGNQTFNSYY